MQSVLIDRIVARCYSKLHKTTQNYVIKQERRSRGGSLETCASRSIVNFSRLFRCNQNSKMPSNELYAWIVDPCQ